MSLFTKKKSKDDLKQALMPPKPELPEFPDLPEDTGTDFSPYEATIADIKSEVERGEDNVEIPRRKPLASSNTIENDSYGEPTREPEFTLRPSSGDKPVFVKIEKYKEAVKHIEMLSKKLADAEDILNELSDIKVKEEQKIEEWKKDLASMKDRLLSIDKELFGD